MRAHLLNPKPSPYRNPPRRPLHQLVLPLTHINNHQEHLQRERQIPTCVRRLGELEEIEWVLWVEEEEVGECLEGGGVSGSSRVS